jgi:hypothetical protein
VKQIHFSLTGAQTGSGVVADSAASVDIAAEGITTLTYFAVDNADNQEAPQMLVVRIDRTPPAAVATRTPDSNAAGWTNSNVTVTWSLSDPESDVASAIGCGATIVSAETAGQTVTCTATNGAGLTTTESVVVRIDKTPPTVVTIRTPEPNSNAGTTPTWRFISPHPTRCPGSRAWCRPTSCSRPTVPINR